ncbi:MAG: hypothetical protein MJ180_01745 [Candidatus Gastranaerophilales bacterium]|nr:hypothetical protein [Candidatus Gastranaerophilales bacterium]
MVANLADIEPNKINNIIQKPILSLVKNESSNSPTNNISELLAGNIEKENNISDIKDKDLQKAKDKNNSGILSHLLGFGLGILLGIPLTMLLVKTNSFGHFFNFFSKTKCAKNLQKALRPQFIKRELRARKAQLANFKYIKFRKCTNMKRAKRLAQRLGITIQAEQKDIAQLNDTLSVFTDLYNQSKGRISMPKKLAIVKDLKNYSADANRLFTIRLTSCSDRGDLLHELGHINHFKKLGFDKDLILEIKQFKGRNR